MLHHIAMLSMAGVLVLTPAVPDQTPDPSSIDLSSIMSTVIKAGPGAQVDSDKEFPDFKKVTEGMESKKGLFTLWYYPPDAKDKDGEKLLCQIPAGFLGQQFMLSTSMAGGGMFTGFPLEERVVQWQVLGKQLLLIEPETRFVVDKSKEVGDAVRRTYPERIRQAIPIVTKSPAGDPVIDLGPLLKSDFADIGWMSRMSFLGGGFGGGGINRMLSKWTTKKAFESNVEIGVELAMGRSSPPGSYDKKMVHYSFWKLKESDYQPRVADDRVGYFLTTNQDWSKPTAARDLFNRYIDRWHLVKRDPSLPMCEPKHPIVFYIEKTVPVRFRRAVRDGILEWNKAFEKIGFLNAIVVRQQTDDNIWKDLDPEDMEHSFFRWIVTGAGFAMGPHRGNPFTGEIYDADIIFDDSMVRFFEREAEQLLISSAVASKFSDPALGAFLEEHPQWQRATRDWEYFSFDDGSEKQLRAAMRERMRERGYHCCEYAHGMQHQMALAQTVMAGQPREVIDRLLYDVIKEVVMHEVGHTLGLRHNFKASSIYSVEEIQKRRTTGEATVGSVMDYNPLLFFADKATEGHFITPTIGPYDYWAIEYGYRPFDSTYEGSKKKAVEQTDSEQTGSEPKTETSEKAAVFKAPAGAKVKVDVGDIPKEVLDQLPPEVRKMLESGNLDQMMAMAGADAAGMPSRPGAPAGPAFKAAPAGEAGMLAEIAARSTEPELAYGTDEDATFLGPDPTVNRFDMGDDPLDWARTRMELVEKRMANILDWAVKDQESWYHVRRAFVSLWVEKAFVLDYVGRYIGGQRFNRAHRGDENAEAPFVIVDAQRQREALSFIEETLFSDKFFTFDANVLNHLAPPRWWHQGSSVSYTMDFPVHEYVALFQWWNLFDRLFPNTLRRIHDAELKSNGSDRFTVAEYLQRVQKGCWAGTTNAQKLKSGTWTDNAPFVSDVRRSLQREYLGLMEPMVRSRPGDVISPDLHAMVKYSLQKLAAELESAINTGKADFASQAHLVSCKSRIDRMLAPDLDEYRRYGGGMSMFGQTAGN